MALSQKHRVALYEHFLPRLGDDVTEAFLAEFPDREGGELVTREHLRAELADVRAEFADLRAEVRAEFADVRGEFRTEFAVVRKEMAEGFGAMNRRLTTVVLSALGVSLAAYGGMTAVIITTLR